MTLPDSTSPRQAAHGNDGAPRPEAPGRGTIVLVGLMGAGKSCIGRRLGPRLGLPFVDADSEIEAAAGCSIEEIFARHGEAAFRSGERRVIERLLQGEPKVLSTGGGAFMDPRTREVIRRHAVVVWLRADLELLLKRVSRRNNRPLLKNGDKRGILAGLIEQRHPVYAEADLVVDSVDSPPEQTVERVARALRTLGERPSPERLWSPESEEREEPHRPEGRQEPHRPEGRQEPPA